ncbi:hypothetical protein FRC04_004218 [Tulasnella sp. 424]|nr:hypothetical protein FRC04_004218 [Tulasnella sp. 424]KAG8964050.1 hypothetical protein FRC05_004334 [Tulasnella sp. 425]
MDRNDDADRRGSGLGGLGRPEDIVEVRRLYAMQAKKFRKAGKKNEADTHISDLKPKHLFSGKRGFKTNRR